MPKVVSIIPQGGISRLPMANDASPGTPFDLNNCRVFTDAIRPVREGDTPFVPSGLEDGGGKPFLKQNGNWVTGCQREPSVVGEVVMPGDSVTAGDWHNGWLYATSCDCGQSDCAGQIRAYKPEWDGTEDPELSPPRIISINPVTWTIPENVNSLESEVYQEGIGPEMWVSYLLIPKNKRGEAGEWAYTWFYNDADFASGEARVPLISAALDRPDDGYIEIYRTKEYRWRDAKPGGVIDNTDACEPRQFYYLGTLSETHCADVEEFCDAATLLPVQTITGPVGFDPIYLNVTPKPMTWGAPIGSISQIYRLPLLGISPLPRTNYDTIIFTDGPYAGNEYPVVGGYDPDSEALFQLMDPVDGANPINEVTATYVDIVLTEPLDVSYQVRWAQIMGWEVELCATESTAPGDSYWGRYDRAIIRDYVRDADGGLEDGTSGAELDPEVAPSLPPNATTLTNTQNIHASRYWGIGRVDPARNEMVPTTSDGDPLGLCANAVLSDAGTMIYGGVTVPTKQPKASFVIGGQNADQESPWMRFIYEYEIGGEKVYGPPLDINNAGKVNIEYGGGEVALLSFVYSTTAQDYVLWERVPFADVTSDRGVYNYVGDCDGCYTFDVDSWGIDKIDDTDTYTGTYDPTECLVELNKGYLSESLRPFEVTYHQFQVENSREEIRHLARARLDEEESQASYSFYVATDQGVYYARRSDKTVVLDRITPLTGVALGVDRQPLWATTHFGGVFVGTDGHLWYITGRDLVRLSREFIESPGKDGFYTDLWQRVYDIAYHTRFREVWVATGTGVWAFDMGDLNPANRQGVVAHYDMAPLFPGGGACLRLWFDRDDITNMGNRNALGNMWGSGGPLDDTRVFAAEGDYMPNPSVTFNRMGEGNQRLKPEWVAVDFDPYPIGGDVLGAGGYDYGSITVSARPRTLIDTPANATVPGPGQTLPSIEPGSRRYPKVSGAGLRFKFENFEELRQIDVQISGVSRNR